MRARKRASSSCTWNKPIDLLLATWKHKKREFRIPGRPELNGKMPPPNEEGNEKELQATFVKKEREAITTDPICTEIQSIIYLKKFGKLS